MRGEKKKMKRELIKIFAAFLFVFGLLLAGSDGGWFPWPNVAGMGMVACVTFLAGEPAE